MFSKLVRRTHMYLALFLFPWILMYALSTLAMNHRAIFTAKYGPGPVPFEKERELVYAGFFPENAEPRVISQQILSSVGLDGAARRHPPERRSDRDQPQRSPRAAPPHLHPGRSPRAHREAAPSSERRPGTLPPAPGLCHRLPPRHRVGRLGRSRHHRHGVLGGLRPLDVVGDDSDSQARPVGSSWRRRASSLSTC